MKSYASTMIACYLGYFTQAVVVNIAPLFFVIFQEDYGISTATLSGLILLNFIIQLSVDALSIRLINRFGYRSMSVLAHLAAATGLICLGVLPPLLPYPVVGVVIATLLYAFGGGMIEVVGSPIVQALPNTHKELSMSILHSFYSWGQMLVVLLTTVLLMLIGDCLWFTLPLLWAIVPLINAVLFFRVPFAPMVTDAGENSGIGNILRGVFPLFMLCMLAGGASEIALSQWASFFAERGLGMSKMLGDLCGPCLFALCMGTGRVLYGLFGKKIDLRRTLFCSAVLCAVSYLLVSLSPFAWLSLVGCALCGFSVSLMWPGTISFAAARYPKGGTLLFGILALCGDTGCSLGPWLAGTVAAMFEQSVPEKSINIGILSATVFPLLLIAVICILIKKEKRGVHYD